MAVWLVNSWLLLRDTNLLESKKSVARAYIASIAPRLRASGESRHGHQPGARWRRSPLLLG
jgi:hypothetical protein